jgi:CubicO group peptidase (beta-lactamase class C family)
MRLSHSISALVLTGVLHVTLAAQAADPLPRAKPEEVGMSSERLALIAKAVNAEVARDQLPGAVLAIARRGKLVYFETFGYRDKLAGVPMGADTIFNIASMTKPMTAVAALQLYEQGKLLLDEPVARYFPKIGEMKVAVMDEKKEKILSTVPPSRRMTVQDLFRHTSGLGYGNRGDTAVHKLYPAGSGPASDTMTGAEFVDKLASLPLLHHPAAEWNYGFGLDVLGLIVEQVTEQSLGQYMAEHIWKPLGMVDTGFVVPADKADRYAKPLPNDPDTGRPVTIRPNLQPRKFECGGGCLASTVNDYMRFASMLVDRGTYDGARILGRKTAEYMTSNHLPPGLRLTNTGPRDYGFGLGVAVRTMPGVTPWQGSVGDFTWGGAQGTNWWGDPKEELAVVWMGYSPGPQRIKYRSLINALVYQAIVD